ncbi:MAG TPA: copper transporter [Nocardioidaceae bacterium]|nr:copper transporter [Nocardioidaceae bacterium]
MISFRYHVVSLLAVLLALAAGVALGCGPLQRDDEGTTATETTGSPTAGDASDAGYARFNDAFAASLTGDLAKGRLQGRTVSLVVLPGASPAQVSALSTVVAQAGASLAGAVRISPDLVDPGKRQLVDELGGQLEAGATKVPIDAGAASYERLGTLLAYAIGTRVPGGDPIDQQGKSILAGLSTAGLISTDEELQRRGNLVVVVAGAPEGDDAEARGSAGIVLSVAKALDAASGGVVLAGPLAAADPSGALTAVRQDTAATESISTVDSADVPAGVIVTLLAMVEQAAEGAGQYGVGPGVTGLRPGVAPTP